MGAERGIGAIETDAQYRAAIATLDRLFARDKRRTPGELAYFRWLAGHARDHEVAPRPRPRAQPPRAARRAPATRPPGAEHGRAFAGEYWGRSAPRCWSQLP